MPTLRAELESLLHRVITPTDLHMALADQGWATILLPNLPPAKHTPPGEWFSKLTQLTDQHDLSLIHISEPTRPY